MFRSTWLVAIAVFFMSVLLSACQSGDDTTGESRVLATVYNHDLHEDDIPDDLLQNQGGQDSIALINAYVDQWVRKMLLLHEAEKRKPESLDIDKLIEDYKQSLLINNLEKQVIDEEMDTIITQKEMERIYEQTKGNFIQEFPIIRLNYIKIPEKTPRIDRFYEWWRKEEFNRMDGYIEKYASSAILGKDDWWEWNEIQNQIDPDILQRYSFKKPRSIQKNIGEFEYFINVYEFVDKGAVSPLSFIEEQIKNIIIQKRKVTVMDEYLERLYQNEINNKKIILHSS